MDYENYREFFEDKTDENITIQDLHETIRSLEETDVKSHEGSRPFDEDPRADIDLIFNYVRDYKEDDYYVTRLSLNRIMDELSVNTDELNEKEGVRSEHGGNLQYKYFEKDDYSGLIISLSSLEMNNDMGSVLFVDENLSEFVFW